MLNKIYISGKISGIENEAFYIFQKAETNLIKEGFEPVNPMKLNHNHDKSWSNFMKEDIKALCDCDSIYMLKNWTESRGAIIEHGLAIMLEIKIYYEK